MFTIRTTKPTKGNKFYTRKASGGYSTCVKGKPTDACDVLSNCVGYANGRFNEIYAELTGYKGSKYNTLNCNAENFIERAKAAGLEVGNTPKAGAIICWQKGATLSGNDGAGHVAVVEKVIDANTIYTSESNYGGTTFYNSTRKNTNGKWGISSAYTFRGFIYNPAVKDETPKKTNAEIAKEVIAGKWGSGTDRKNKITAAGYNYAEIQTEVNKLLNSNKTTTTKLDRKTAKAGSAIALNNEKLYASATATNATPYAKTGTFYFYDNVVSNGRRRITVKADYANKKPVANYVTGWINV